MRNAWSRLPQLFNAASRPASRILATSVGRLTLLPHQATRAASSLLTPGLSFATAPITSLASHGTESIREPFLSTKEELSNDFNEELTARFGDDRSSIEAGHKIVAFRSTVLSRIHLELESEYGDPLLRSKAEIGTEELAKKVAQNEFYIRFTMHPTEGQNLPTILGKDAIIKITTIISKANLLSKADLDEETKKNLLAELVLNLVEVVKTHNVKNDSLDSIVESKTLPSVADFLQTAKEIRRGFIRNFVVNPIHHTEKMAMETEREVLMHHLSRTRKEAAEIAADHSEVVNMEQMRFSTWATDLDGKPHVKPGYGVIVGYEGQKTFFKDLLIMLESFKTHLDLRGEDGELFAKEVIAPISEMSKSQHLFHGEERQDNERKISELLQNFAESNAIGQETAFVRIQKYAGGTGCRVAKNMATTREEVDKTNQAFDEVAKLCGDDILGRFNDPEFMSAAAKTLAENFSKLSVDSQRQVMFQMESAVLDQRHEHIISQFDCDLESYRKTLALFEISKHLPQCHHDKSITHFEEYYGKASEGLGIDLRDQLFSPQAIEAAKKSMVEVSPLAEDKKTIPKLVDFTTKLLADKPITDYIKKSGGVLRQTRSNSDGSSSLGPQKVTYEYLKADMEIREMVEKAGLKLEILSGIGANDIERMAPWTLDLLHSQFTAQGGDAQHQTGNRLRNMLIKDSATESEKQLADLEEKYGKEKVRSLADFYYDLHLQSEEGFDVTVGDKTAKSGHMTSRGTIAHEVVGLLGRSSARPDARNAAGKKAPTKSLMPNDFDIWGESVFNPQVRRIGAISLQRISGLITFLTGPFARNPQDFDPDLVADFSKIGANKNIAISAIFAAATADIKSFILINGFPADIKSEAIVDHAEKYEKFLRMKEEESRAEEGSSVKVVAAAKVVAYAQENSFDTPEGIRAGHLSMQINNLKFVLRNALGPLAHNCDQQTKDKLEKIFNESEAGGVIKDYSGLVIKACKVLIEDAAIDIKTKETLVCVAQQISNVKRPGNYCDIRQRLIKETHDASQENDQERAKAALEDLAKITRSAGNPLSPGRKAHEMLPYFRDSFGDAAGRLKVDIAPQQRQSLVVEEAPRIQLR